MIIIITILQVLALHIAFSGGNILGFVSKIGYYLPINIQKPLFLCYPCMCMWYSLAKFLFNYSIIDSTLMALACFGAGYCLNAVLDLIKDINIK
jgi:hypothetical protein